MTRFTKCQLITRSRLIMAAALGALLLAAAMTMRVEAILGGTGQIRQIEIPHEGGVYRGFAVQVFDEEKGRWVRHYTNKGRGRFTRLEGEVDGDRSTWWVTSVERTRESKLLSERIGADRWRRTMSISKDGGRSRNVLWIDELRRTGAP